MNEEKKKYKETCEMALKFLEKGNPNLARVQLHKAVHDEELTVGIIGGEYVWGTWCKR